MHVRQTQQPTEYLGRSNSQQQFILQHMPTIKTNELVQYPKFIQLCLLRYGFHIIHILIVVSEHDRQFCITKLFATGW